MLKLPEPTLSALRREHLVALIERLSGGLPAPRTIAFAVWDVEHKKVNALLEKADELCNAAAERIKAVPAGDLDAYLDASQAYDQALKEWDRAEAAVMELDAYFKAHVDLSVHRPAKEKQP